MCQSLKQLIPVDLNEVWETEPHHFTPWLAKEENLTLLGNTLGMELELEAQEINVGGFRADILCKNSDWTQQYEWLATRLERFDQVFRPRITALNSEDWMPENDDE